MLFWLKKSISFWLMPLPFCLTVLVLGLWLTRSAKRSRLGRTLLFTGVGLLMLFSNPTVSTWLLRPLETRFPSQADLSAKHPPTPALVECRYIAVLGGGHNDLPDLFATNRLTSASLARAVEGARLARALPNAQVITSGPPAQGAADSHAAVVAGAIESLGMDAARLVRIETAHDTEDEANAVRRLVGDASVALVTSAWHMPRAAGLFHRAGVRIVPCPTDFLTKADGAPKDWWQWVWNIESLERSTSAVHEYLGLAWVRLRGKFHNAP